MQEKENEDRRDDFLTETEDQKIGKIIIDGDKTDFIIDFVKLLTSELTR